MTDKNIYKVGDRVEVISRSSRHNGKHGVIERVLYKVRFDDGGDSAFVEDSLANVDDPEMENDPRYKSMVKMWGEKIAKEKYIQCIYLTRVITESENKE